MANSLEDVARLVEEWQYWVREVMNATSDDARKRARKQRNDAFAVLKAALEEANSG